MPPRARTLRTKLSALVLGLTAALMSIGVAPLLIGPPRTESPQAAQRDPLALIHPIRLSDHPVLVLDRGRLSSERSDGAPRLLLDKPRFDIDMRAKPGGAIDVTGAANPHLVHPLAGVIAGLGYEQLSIRHGELVVRLDDHRTMTFSDVSAEVSLRRKPLTTLAGEATFKGQRVAFEASVGALSDTKSGTQRFLRISAQSSLGRIDFDGRGEFEPAQALAGALELTSKDPAGFARWLSIGVGDAGAYSDLSLKGQLDWRAGGAMLRPAELTLDRGSTGSGQIAVSLRNRIPLVDASLAFTRLDVEPAVVSFLPPGRRKDSITAWQQIDLTMPGHRIFDGDIRLSAAEVALGDLPLGQGAATISMRGGRVDVDVAELVAGRDRLNLQVGIDGTASDKAAHVRGRVELADAATLSRALFDAVVLSGRAVAQLDLKSHSSTVLERMLSESSGRLTLQGNGSKSIFDLQQISPVVAAARDNRPGAATLFIGRTPSLLDGLDLRFTVSGNAWHLDQGTVRTPQATTAVSGQLDLARRTLDLRLVPRPLKAADKAAKSPSTEPPSIVVRGPWSAPSVAVLDRVSPTP